MLINSTAVNAAAATGYLTGDINGPTLVWADMQPGASSWAKATEPTISVGSVGSGTNYFLLLALTSGGGSSGSIGVWTPATGTSTNPWHKETV